MTSLCHWLSLIYVLTLTKHQNYTVVTQQPNKHL